MGTCGWASATSPAAGRSIESAQGFGRGRARTRRPLRREWQGEPVAGRRLLIWPEQGFGDQIQFARYALALKAQGAEVTLVCPPELHALFAELPLTVAAGAQSLTIDQPDYWTLALSVAASPGREPGGRDGRSLPARTCRAPGEVGWPRGQGRGR